MQDVSVATLRRLVTPALPEASLTSWRVLGRGQDHVAYEVDGGLVVRAAIGPAPGNAEGRVLALVRDISPLPVPEPLLALDREGVLVYRKLPGVPLLARRADLGRLDVRAVGARLGAFLTALHTAPVERFEGVVPRDDDAPEDWLAEAREQYAAVVGAVPAQQRAGVEAFLAAPPPPAADTLGLCHNDLGIEHVLVDPGTLALTGIIDWGDAAIGDPAYDLGLLLRDLGPRALAAVLEAYAPASPALAERVEFYARCAVFEDLAYGLEPGHEAYREQALWALRRLFATGSPG